MDHATTSVDFIRASAFLIGLGVGLAVGADALIHIAVKKIKEWFDE